MLNSNILENNFVPFTEEGFYFGEFKSGEPHEKPAVANWTLGTISFLFPSADFIEDTQLYSVSTKAPRGLENCGAQTN
jgi:hypothetical protein